MNVVVSMPRRAMCILALCLYALLISAVRPADAQSQSQPAPASPTAPAQPSGLSPSPPAAEPAAAPSAAAPAETAKPSSAPAIAAPGSTETPAVVVEGNAADTLLGKPVKSAGGDDMGRIVDVMVDHTGLVRAAIIDFGGFLGVGTRKIAVDWRVLHFPKDGSMDKIVADLSQDQLRVAPIYKAGEPVVIVGRADIAPTPPPSTPAASAPAASAPAASAPAPSAPAPSTAAPVAPSPPTPIPTPAPAPGSVPPQTP